MPPVEPEYDPAGYPTLNTGSSPERAVVIGACTPVADAADDEAAEADDEDEWVLVFWRRTSVVDTVDGSAVNALLISTLIFGSCGYDTHVINPIIDLVPC